jgi:triosephosphate isomerase
MRKTVIAGNWKMNLTPDEAGALAERLAGGAGRTTEVDVALFPPFPYLERVLRALSGSGIAVGAQNVAACERGACTGEVSADMLARVGCSLVLVGHSERRRYFGESDGDVNRKVRLCLGRGLTPLLCVGETLAEREAGRTEDVLNRQLVYGLQSVESEVIGRMIVAYEPVWAIGTGVSASGDQAEATHRFIRGVLERFAGAEAASGLRLLYGGSVSAGNAGELLSRENIDGALVGGASLDAHSFGAIVDAAVSTRAARAH